MLWRTWNNWEERKWSNMACNSRHLHCFN